MVQRPPTRRVKNGWRSERERVVNGGRTGRERVEKLARGGRRGPARGRRIIAEGSAGCGRPVRRSPASASGAAPPGPAAARSGLPGRPRLMDLAGRRPRLRPDQVEHDPRRVVEVGQLGRDDRVASPASSSSGRPRGVVSAATRPGAGGGGSPAWATRPTGIRGRCPPRPAAPRSRGPPPAPIAPCGWWTRRPRPRPRPGRGPAERPTPLPGVRLRACREHHRQGVQHEDVEPVGLSEQATPGAACPIPAAAVPGGVGG